MPRALTAAGIACLAAAIYRLWPVPPGTCPHDPASCFFSDGYLSARLRFREAAARVNASLERLVVCERRDLTIDVAVLQADTSLANPPTLVHFSGTHGVEAYAGSAVQLALLQQWASQPPRGVRVVLVHAVNPYGFRCSRRWNEDGADLNRNALAPSEFAALASEAERRSLYDAHEWLFNARRPWAVGLDDAIFLGKAVYAIAVLGSVNVKRAVVAGQYHSSDGLYYGGAAMAASHRLLIPALQRLAAPTSAAILVDVHTGLGPSGVDTLVPSFENEGSAAAAQADAAAIHDIFGAAAEGGPKLGVDFLIDAPTPGEAEEGAVSAGYELAKGTTARYARLVGKDRWPRALVVGQEFGTLPGPLVLRGMALERAEFTHRPAEGDAGALCGGGSTLGARAVTHVFYPASATWQRKVVGRGVHVANQAVAALAARPDAVPMNA